MSKAPAAYQSADASHAARSVVLQVLAALGQAGLLVYQALVARFYGQLAHGLFVASLTWVEVLTRTALIGADKGMFRYVAAHRAGGRHHQQAAAIGAALRVAALASAILTVGVWLLGPTLTRWFGKPDLAVPLRGIAPTVVFMTLMIVLVAASLGARTSRVSLVVRGITEPALLLVAVLTAWVLGVGLGGLAVAHSVAYLLVLVAAVFAVRKVFGRGELTRALREPPQRGFVAFCLPLGVSETLNVIMQRADLLLMPVLMGVDSVAVYYAADQLARSAAGLRPLFDGIVGPVISEALEQHNRERLRYNLQLVTRWVALASAPIAVTLVALGPDLLGGFGGAYRVGAAALALLVLGHMINGIVGSTPAVLTMSGRSRQFMWNNLGAVVLNVSLNLTLIPRFGLVGAAASACLSVAALQGALAIQVWMIERVHPFSWQLLKPLVAAAVVLAYQLLLRLTPLPVAPRIALMVVGGAAIYLAVYLLLRPAAEERQLLEKAWAKVRRRG